MKKCSLFLILALLLTMFSGVNLVSAAEVPEGYIEIASAEDFMTKIAANSSGKYYLTADIELPSTYEPIANFSGELIGADETNLKSIKLPAVLLHQSLEQHPAMQYIWGRSPGK